MSSRRLAVVLGAACLAATATPAAAQPAEAFAAALDEVAVQAKGLSGKEGPLLLGAIDRLALALERWDGVIANMEKGLAAEIGRAPRPAAARMRATLGTAYLERGRSADALRELDLAVMLEPQLAVAHTLRAIALERLNRPREARTAFARAWQHGQDAATAYQFLRSARQASPAPPPGDMAKARTTLTEAVSNGVKARQDPPELLTVGGLGAALEAALYAPVHYAAAFALIRQYRFAEGITALRTAAASDSLVTGRDNPRDERARLSAVDLLVQTGDTTSAVKALQATAALFPQSWQVWWRLGTMLERLGDGAGALQAVQAAEKIAGTPSVYEALGRLHHNQLNLEAAAAAYERASAALPTTFHYELGVVYRDIGRVDDAMTEFAIAALLAPGDTRAFAELGQLYAAKGDDARAVPLLRDALASNPDLLAARYALSRALLRLGQRDEAARELEIFQQQQRKAMEEERRRFDENSRKIDEVLKSEPATNPK